MCVLVCSCVFVCMYAFSSLMLSRCVVFGQHTCQDESSLGRGTTGAYIVLCVQYMYVPVNVCVPVLLDDVQLYVCTCVFMCVCMYVCIQ